MTNEELEKQNLAIFQTQHREWLNSPITRALSAALERHESNITRRLGIASMNVDVTSEFVRLLGAQLSVVQTIRTLIQDAKSIATISRSAE